REVKALVVFLLAATATACTVGPTFKRPAVDLPPTFRGAPSDDAANATAFGDQAWWDVFEDERLRELIDTALRQNFDLRIAAARGAASDGDRRSRRRDVSLRCARSRAARVLGGGSDCRPGAADRAAGKLPQRAAWVEPGRRRARRFPRVARSPARRTRRLAVG